MYQEIKVGSTTVPMLANGATPIRFRMVFKKDLIATFHNSEDNTASASECIPELAFIMAKAAEAQQKKDGKLMSLLNQETFIEWLEQFEPLDLLEASDQIIELYAGNQVTTAKAKKNEDQVKES